MNEPRRTTYLNALGIDAYVSRSQLPGAAPTKRLRIKALTVAGQQAAPATGFGADVGDRVQPGTVPSGHGDRTSTSPAVPRIERPRSAPAAAVAKVGTGKATQAPERFSLAAIAAGGWLWLELLPEFVVSREQVQLIHAMSLALAHISTRRGDTNKAVSRAAPDVAQFDWPVHTNQQLDLGPEAARAGLAGFVARRIEQKQCRGTVILGAGSLHYAPRDLLQDVPAIATLGTFEMLADYRLKQQAWQDLRQAAAGA
tara:strand:- start:268431 stop:269198 length:768 start_codon:yes stop_codon:yes gene_type:complete